MNGLVSIETDEIVFSDGTSMTTNDFAAASDLATVVSQVNSNSQSISNNTSSINGKMDAFTAGAGLAFNSDDELDAEVTSDELNAKADDYDVGTDGWRL